MRRPFPANNYCPCGSYLKYKKCCQPKGIEYFIKPNGQIVRQEVLSPERKAAFEEQKRQFMERHGRKPTEEEEGLMRASGFDDLQTIIAKDLSHSGAAPEIVYAYEKTGILVTRENRYQIAGEELQKWEQAIEEYRRLKGA